tara:strand:- start:278 stop:1225 length:948 start_codon:yes stop_codon:yes gene_type:complete
MVNEKIKMPEIISSANNNNWMHVFLVVNPIVASVSRLIKETYKLKESNILTVSLRNTDLSIMEFNKMTINESFKNKIMFKIFKSYPNSKKILNKIGKDKKFILYSSWAFKESPILPSVGNLVSSNNCMGHVYIEEGQATYRPSKPFSPDKSKRHNAVNAENLKDMYRNDADAFIGILPDAFPEAPKEKLYILDNLIELKQFYNPILIGTETIGLTCAERRLKKNQWKNMLQKLIDNMPNGGVIKLHASFLVNKNIKNRLYSIFQDIAPDSISICDDKAIIELEMLYEKKKLLGSLTSLEKYADAFGSEFNKISLY